MRSLHVSLLICYAMMFICGCAHCVDPYDEPRNNQGTQ